MPGRCQLAFRSLLNGGAVTICGLAAIIRETVYDPAHNKRCPLMSLAAVCPPLDCVWRVPDMNVVNRRNSTVIPVARSNDVEGFCRSSLQMARGGAVQAVMGGYPNAPIRGELMRSGGCARWRSVLCCRWADTPRALACAIAVELDRARPGYPAQPVCSGYRLLR